MPLYQGTYFSKNFTLKGSDGDPLDMTGWTFRAHVRDRTDDELLLELSTENTGMVLLDGPNGRLTMVMTPEQTLSLPVGTMVFDVLRTDPATGAQWLFGGRFKVKQPVTRDED